MATKTAPLPEATTGEIVEVGGFRSGKPSKVLQIFITDAFRDLAMGGDKRIYELCGTCDTSGFRSGFAHVMGGICFHCNGSGIHAVYADTLEDAQKKVRRATARRNTEARKAAERAAKYAEDKALYASQNAGQIQRVTEWLEARDLLEPSFTWNGNQDDYYTQEHAYNAELNDWFDRRDASADAYAIKLINDILGDIHMADAKERPTAARWATAEKFMRQYEGKEEARKAQQDASRYAGDIKEKVTITGKVAAIFDATATFGYNTSYRKGIIIKGTGADAGITFKWIASGATQYGVDVDDTVTITGTVKELAEYKGVKQTVVTRCKYEVQK